MSETKGDRPDRPRGARPIRKRGYHRALKRGEWWARIDCMAARMALDLAQRLFYGPREITDDQSTEKGCKEAR